jgi:hypothetical protein
MPVFYLKRWCSDDRKLCEYSRPYKKIYSQRVFPVQTGFLDRLYEKKGVPKAIAQQVEDKFMKPVDTLAADALNLIETEDERIRTDPKYRSAWSLFLITPMTRMPEDLVVLSQILADDWRETFRSLGRSMLPDGRRTTRRPLRNSSRRKIPITWHDGP